MLVSQPQTTCDIRRQVATDLLTSDDNLLENTTLKLKTICRQDLETIRDSNGVMDPTSQLHGILAMAASQIRLDAGRLESLNSSMKAAMHLANNNNISLELLSSRVCMRRLVTMYTKGVSKLKVVRPVLEKISTSASLYHGTEHETLTSTYRPESDILGGCLC